jgi:prevent-host-death family protein
MISVNTHEAKSRLSELLIKVEKKQETIVICRNGVPIAELTAWHKNKNPLSQSSKLKNVKFYQDPSLPLDEKDWPRDSR